MKFITYDAGCGIWEVELFSESVDWHHSAFHGTEQECEVEATEQMKTEQPHYRNPEYRSIYDY